MNMKLMLKAHCTPLKAMNIPAAATKRNGENIVTIRPSIITINPMTITFFLPNRSPKRVRIRKAKIALRYMINMAKLSVEASSLHL